MPDEIVRGRSLEEIRQEWSQKLGILPNEFKVEVLEKPGLLSRQWKVKLSWDEDLAGSEPQTEGAGAIQVLSVQKDGKYTFICPEGLTEVVPFPIAGTLTCQDKVKEEAFFVSVGEVVEFQPRIEPGQLTWQLEVRMQGLSVVAKVRKQKAGRYALPPVMEVEGRLELEKRVQLEEMPPSGEFWNEAHIDNDLSDLHVIYGRRSEAWAEILAVEDGDEVVIAEATLPINPQPSRLDNFVNVQLEAEEDDAPIDYFASKIELVKEGAVLARKIPGKPGEPGKDVYGRLIPVQVWKDFQFRLKKNVKLSEDGLEVLATCQGRPVRFDEYTFGVDNVYLLNQDVDLASGSIEFPGDVIVNGNVQDGLRIVAQGKVEIRGAVSHAEIRAENGVKIQKTVHGGKIIVGENYVVRSEILRRLRELREELHLCLSQTAELVASPGAARLKPGQCLKLIIERNFPELPKKASDAEKYFLEHKHEIITEELVVSIRAAKRFTNGLGPLEPPALQFLTKVEKVLDALVSNISLEIPDKLKCEVEYIQGTTVESGGDFICSKGVYNSSIRVDGNIDIQGVCRGGKIIAGGNVTIKELGGSEVSNTFVQITAHKRLKVEYCHPNVVIAVNKEIIRIEEAYKKLEIFKEHGRLEVEKLRVNPL